MKQGSLPWESANNGVEAQVVEQEPFKLKEVGSIPTSPTKKQRVCNSIG